MKYKVLVRVAIELVSPLSIHSGERETLRDEKLALDWNGLPYIPATSLTGVLRSAMEAELNAVSDESHNTNNEGKELPFSGKELLSSWFGSSGDKNKSGAASWVSVGCGLLLDSKSQAHPELESPHELGKDSLYELFLKQETRCRDRCRINQHGVASKSGKFDMMYIPAGARFLFDLTLELPNFFKGKEFDVVSQSELFLKHLGNILDSGNMRLGNNTRNGLGEFKVYSSLVIPINPNAQSTKQGSKPSSSREEVLKAYDEFYGKAHDPIKAPNSLVSNHKSLKDYADQACNEQNSKNHGSMVLLADLPMQAIDTWAIGRGFESAKRDDNGTDNPKNTKNIAYTYTEKSLEWKGPNFSKEIKHVKVCGSMLKGILSHRTLFHYYRLKGITAKDVQQNINPKTGELDSSSVLAKIFGQEGGKKGSKAQAGLVIVDEVLVKNIKPILRAHNRLDYFSAGVINGALFTEERLYKPQLRLKIRAKRNLLDLNADVENRVCLEALAFAISDIKEGYLPISAGSGREGGLMEIDKDSKESSYMHEILSEALRNALSKEATPKD